MNHLNTHRMLFARQGRTSTGVIRRWLITWAVGVACGYALRFAVGG